MLNYIEHDELPPNFHKLGISMVNVCRNNSGIEEETVIELDLGPTPNVLREKYLDVYEGIHSEIVNTTRFDENSDLSSTYLGKSNRSRSDKLKAEESFPIPEHRHTSGKLLDGTECKSLLDTGASKLFRSKSFYMHCKSLYTLPKFAS